MKNFETSDTWSDKVINAISSETEIPKDAVNVESLRTTCDST